MSDQQNPMDFSFSMKGVETAFPSLATAEYRVAFNGYKVKPTKNQGEHQFRIECATQEPATDTKGKSHPPGFKVGFNLTTPVGGDNDEIRIKMMAQFLDAVHGVADEKGWPDGERPDFSGPVLNEHIGRQFIIVVKPAKDTQYGDTEVKGFKFIPQAPSA
jgi:hypothetical protein